MMATSPVRKPAHNRPAMASFFEGVATLLFMLVMGGLAAYSRYMEKKKAEERRQERKDRNEELPERTRRQLYGDNVPTARRRDAGPQKSTGVPVADPRQEEEQREREAEGRREPEEEERDQPVSLEELIGTFAGEEAQQQRPEARQARERLEEERRRRQAEAQAQQRRQAQQQRQAQQEEAAQRQARQRVERRRTAEEQSEAGPTRRGGARPAPVAPEVRRAEREGRKTAAQAAAQADEIAREQIGGGVGYREIGEGTSPVGAAPRGGRRAQQRRKHGLAGAYRRLLSDPSRAQRAIILHEVLGPPAGLRQDRDAAWQWRSGE